MYTCMSLIKHKRRARIIASSLPSKTFSHTGDFMPSPQKQAAIFIGANKDLSGKSTSSQMVCCCLFVALVHRKSTYN